MNKKQSIGISVTCFIIGLLLYAIQQEWIILNVPYKKKSGESQAFFTTVPTKQQKQAALWYWQREAWHHETSALVWASCSAQNIHYLINSWLAVLHDEKITAKKIALQAAAFNNSGNELYLSFDRSLFSKESTTYDKWMLIEGLLKTIRENDITPHAVRFLIDHQPMTDSMLDFSNPWPLAGFIN